MSSKFRLCHPLPHQLQKWLLRMRQGLSIPSGLGFAGYVANFFKKILILCILVFCLLDWEYSYKFQCSYIVSPHYNSTTILQCPTYECGRIYPPMCAVGHMVVSVFTMMNNKTCVLWCLCFLCQAPIRYILHVKHMVGIAKLLSRAMKLTYVFIHSPWHLILSRLFISSLSNSCRKRRILLL